MHKKSLFKMKLSLPLLLVVTIAFVSSSSSTTNAVQQQEHTMQPQPPNNQYVNRNTHRSVQDGGGVWYPNHHHHHHDSSVGSLMQLQPSPECWQDAMRAVTQLEQEYSTIMNDESSFSSSSSSSSLGTLVCASMSHDHKKALALELARCQMHDVGRPLFWQDNDDDNCSRPMDSVAALHSCLSQMSNDGMHSYTIFFTHVHQTCSRLTQERLMQASQAATEQLHAMLMSQTHVWHDQEERNQELQEKLQQNMNQMWNQVQERDEKIMELTRHVERTTETMKPLLKMESLMAMATNGMTWLTCFIFVLGNVTVIWLFTRSQRLDQSRSLMFWIALVEGLLEVVLHWTVTQGLLANRDCLDAIEILRTYSVTLECIIFVMALIRSLFPTSKTETTDAKYHKAILRQHLELMKLLQANAASLQKEAALEQRVVKVVTPPLQTATMRTSPSPQRFITTVEANDANSDVLLSLPPIYQMTTRSAQCLGGGETTSRLTNSTSSEGRSKEATYHEATMRHMMLTEPAAVASYAFASQQQQQPPHQGHFMREAMEAPSASPFSPEQQVHPSNCTHTPQESEESKKRSLEESKEPECHERETKRLRK